MQTVPLDAYGPSSYGDAFADVYDDWYATIGDDEACVDRLATIARGRPVLELGVGTGRLALPLVRRGCAVTGLDSSLPMLHRLAAKPDAERVQVLVGDMADVPSAGPFGLVFVAYNTFFNLPDEHAQRLALASVARVLEPDGRFVVEAFVPPDRSSGPEEPTIELRSVEEDHLVLTVATRDDDAQTITGEHIEVGADGTHSRPWRVRFLFPAQLDELAREAGLELVERHADWRGATFDDDSPTHVSQYRLQDTRPR